MKNKSSIAAVLVLSTLACDAEAAGTPHPVQHTRAFPSHIVDNRIVRYMPKAGEPYQIAVEYALTTSAPGFDIEVHLGADETTLQTGESEPGRYAWWTDFGNVPLDGPIPFSVVIDPQCAIDGTAPSTANHRLISGFLTPRPPATAVDYYDPHALVGTQTTSIVFSSTDIDSLTFMSGKPDAGAGQEPINDGSMSGRINGGKTFTIASQPDLDPNQYEVYYADLVRFHALPVHVIEYPLPEWIPIPELQAGDHDARNFSKLAQPPALIVTSSGVAWTAKGGRRMVDDASRNFSSKSHLKLGDGWYQAAARFGSHSGSGLAYTFVQNFAVQEFNQRVDAARLRSVTWSDFSTAVASDPLLKYYTRPESVVQSTDPQIRAFITDTLGADYRDTYTPYDAARTIFQAVVARSTYFYPEDGQQDLRAQTAIDMLNTGLGDCGSFTMLLVATFRAMGMPARTAVGAWVGKDSGHAWSELYFPAYDWVIADGSLADMIDPGGTFAYYFGIATDRNQRMVMSRGNTFTTPDGYTASWLQGPAIWWSGNAPLLSWTVSTSIDFGDE